jgi:hypothetical protein
MVMCIVIGCRCPTTPPVAAEGLQTLARALKMGAAGGGQGAPVCFRGEGTSDRQHAYDVCIDAAPDSVCGGGRWCAALAIVLLCMYTSGRRRSRTAARRK